MTDNVSFSDESRERSTLRRAEYDDAAPKDLVLTIPSRDGDKLTIPLLKNARSNIEREDYQENTLVRIKPLAELSGNLPVKSGGVTIYQGKGVALLRPGFLYIFRKDKLWRELEISQNSQFSDVDLEAVRAEVSAPESRLRAVRPSAGQWLDDVLVPVFLQEQAVMHEFRMAYSEVQWDWDYICQLEASDTSRNDRTTGVGHAWVVTTVDSLSFETGFPASRVEHVPQLRHRDLGMELMLGNPHEFQPDFKGPGDDELCTKLAKLLKQNQRFAEATASGDQPNDASESGAEEPELLDLTCHQEADLLASLRTQKGVVCVALPDPLFKLRHALAQLHLALHYLDAIDVSIQDRPLVHSAMLIRQSLFAPEVSGSSDQINKLRAVVDKEKLDKAVEHSERQKVLEEITVHITTLETLLNSGEFDVVCGDYLNHKGLGPCEAFALQTSLLDLAQQLPGVLSAQGLKQPPALSGLLKQGLGTNLLIDTLADGESTNSGLSSMLVQLKKLARNQEALTEERLSEVGLSSLSTLAQQLKQEEEGSATDENGGSGSLVSGSVAGTVAGMVQTALGGWSSAILKAAERLRESGDLSAIKLDRVFTSVREIADIADPSLGGELQIMRRGDVDLTRYSIVGVHGEGLSFGLTDADRQSEALTRRNDYLFADRTDSTGTRVASTSPTRMMDEGGEALVKAAAHTWVFVLPAGHPEALKFSAVKFDWATKAKAVADGPGLSRVLVGLAAFNLASELRSLKGLAPQEYGITAVRFFGAGSDLLAASMKLYVISSPADDKLVSKAILRPLFEMKSIPLIGPLIQKRLSQVGAGTIVRTMGLANFIAGTFMVGISAWDYRNSINRGDLDAALGHGLAVAGGSIFVVSKLLSGLLAVPGWGWALFGLGVVLGGSIYAAIATDSEIERVLKQGPLGLGPNHEGLPEDDAVYYSQLLSLLSPVEVSAERYGDLSEAERAMFADYNPSQNDYRVTVSSPLISRFKLGQKRQDKAKVSAEGRKPGLRIGIQELEYTHSTMETSVDEIDDFNLTRKTTLEKIITWVAAPEDHAVYFLVERKLAGGETQVPGYREQRTTSLRVVLQASIESEVGEFRFPMPVLDEYEPFDAARHEALPDKKRHIFNPFENEPVPYWIVKEVAV